MQQPRILMVEDETDILAVNRAYFESQGYAVCCAKTLKEARAAIYENPVDLILLDVLLPDGSGYDFCAEIRSLTTAPVIFLTCMGRDEDTIRGLGLGGDDYVTKPYTLSVLSARIVAALRRRGITGAGRIEKPPLVIDHFTGTITLNGEVISLSQKEMQLLSFLVCHAGQEFTSDQLYNSIWGAGSSPGTIRTHIANLRKKLMVGSEFFEIALTSSRGYMFVQTRYADRFF